MKTKLILRQSSQRPARPFRALLCGLLLLASFLTPPARAGLTFTVDLYVSDGAFVFYTPLNTNNLAPAAAYGTYTIFSPGQPTNGSWRQIIYDTNGLNTTGGGENRYSDLPSALRQITNGTWTLQYSNAVTTNTYHFTVSLPGGLTSNQLPVTLITSPANGATGVTNQPAFTWQGQPTNWPVTGSIYVLQNGNNSSFYYPPSPVGIMQSNWTIPLPIPADGSNDSTLFNLSYVTNYTGTLFVATAPINTTNSQQMAGWLTTSTLESGGQIQFMIAPPPSSSTNHLLIAHYAFDNSGDLGLDSSGNGNNLHSGSSCGANTSQVFTSDAEAGGGAVQFFGESSITPCGGSPPFQHWTNTFFGSFTLSTWIRTTTVVGNDGDQLYDYVGQMVVYMNNEGNGLVPLAITGTKAAFETGLPQGAYGQDTLNSAGTVTTGSYVHVVVTRDQGSGQKQIYINGVLDSSDYGEPGILNGGTSYASIGGELSAPYTGKLDDVQIYSGVLGSNEIANLYNIPGSTAPDGGPLTFGVALNAPDLPWTTNGDTSWFIEATNTYNGAPYAAQSGIVSNSQSSTLSVTVNGPAMLTFYWAAQGSFTLFFYEAYLDGDPNNGYLDNLFNATDWVSDGPFAIPSGQHTVSWTAFANGDNDPTEAGFLDQVTVTPVSVTLLNPQINGASFQFDFLAEPGFTYNVLSTTNLAQGNWATNNTYYGYGSTYRVSVPYNTPAQQFFAVQIQ